MPKSDKQERKQGHKLGHKLKVQTVIVRTPKTDKKRKENNKSKKLKL